MKRIGLLLLTAGLVGIIAVPAIPDSRGAEPAGDADRVVYLRKQFALFQALPENRQKQIRELDQQLNALDEGTQQRLRHVLEDYSAWLAGLHEDDRKRVIGQPNAEERLVVIRELRHMEWLASLPLAYRDQYKAAKTPGERADLIGKWRQEEQDREEEWQIALRNWTDLQQGRIPAPFQLEEGKRLIDHFVQNLDPALNDAERKRLQAARKAAEEGNWVTYGRVLIELSDRHPLLPAQSPGPRTVAELPPALKDKLTRMGNRPLPRQIEAASGRWPDFAWTVARFAKTYKIDIPEQLGACRKEQMPADVRAFIDRTLDKELSKNEWGRRDLERLHEAEGHWPEYPEVLMSLARQYKLVVPGWMLPGKPEFWNNFRVKRARLEQASPRQ
jgi:hypothetical protein